MAEHDEVDRNSGAVHRRDLARMIRLAVVLALVVVFVAVALDNRADVRVGYAIDQALAPGWLVILLSAIGGLVIGWLLRLRSRGSRDLFDARPTCSPSPSPLSRCSPHTPRCPTEPNFVDTAPPSDETCRQRRGGRT